MGQLWNMLKKNTKNLAWLIESFYNISQESCGELHKSPATSIKSNSFPVLCDGNLFITKPNGWDLSMYQVFL